ncbi:imidazole glycerol phosphate synthase subunit HisH [Pseudomonadota bacterium]|nr:imidazole glycerol phosphate synthase subunit HisH [Pseudomonadota bacterium]
MKKVCILNLGYSNIKSVRGAFEAIDVETTVIEKIDSVEINAPLVLPGVGAFGGAMQRLTFGDTGYYLSEAYKKGHPILGICLGMQVMFEGSEEDFKIDGLSFLPGHVRNLNQNKEKFSPPSNIGYSHLHASKNQDLDQYAKFDGENFYFMHSFGLVDDELPTDQKLYINFNDQEVLAMFHYQNLVGIQFHPERSGELGLELLSSIVEEFKV